MSYSSLESSVESGQPIELFRIGNRETIFTYTSAQYRISYNGETYVPRAISKTEDRIESLSARREITVKLPATDALVRRYIITPPAEADTIEIFRFHSSDGGSPEVAQIYSGTISNCAVNKNNEGLLNARSNAAQLERKCLRQTCRASCNFIVFGNRCAVNSTDFQIQGTVAAISSDGLTIDVAGGTNAFAFTGLQLSAQYSSDAGFLLGGTVERAGGLERRMIRGWTDLGGNQARLTLLLPFSSLNLGGVVTVLAGCDQSLETCISRFDNSERYGGFRYIPTKNPFNIGIDV